MTASCPVKTTAGFVASPCDYRSAPWDIIPCPQELLLNDGEFVIESRLGARRICTLTGNTRRLSYWRAATINTFDVDTVVRELPDGTPALWGVRGERFTGTWAINLSALEGFTMDGELKVVPA